MGINELLFRVIHYHRLGSYNAIIEKYTRHSLDRLSHTEVKHEHKKRNETVRKFERNIVRRV